MEKGHMRGIFLAACNEIIAPFGNGAWKPSQKGQCWKKKPENKDLTYEIYFQSSTKNTENYVDIIPHLGIYSSKAKAYDIAQTTTVQNKFKIEYSSLILKHLQL